MTPDDVSPSWRSPACAAAAARASPPSRSGVLQGRARRNSKYVVCNADEGDPGAYMDRSTLEGDPHSILEAMTIAGAPPAPRWATSTSAPSTRWRSGASRTPSPRRAATACWARTSSAAASASTSSCASAPAPSSAARKPPCWPRIEGQRGTHARVPPFPAVKGLWGKPDGHQQRRDARQRAGHHPQGRRLVRQDRHGHLQGHQGLRADRQGQATPASSRCRWAPRCARSSSTSAAASATDKFKAPRPAAPPAASSRPSSSTRRSTTRTSPRSARSWVPAA
jgi:hypothetical protein